MCCEWALAARWRAGWMQRRGRLRLARSRLCSFSMVFSAALSWTSRPVHDFTVIAAASAVSGSTAEVVVAARVAKKIDASTIAACLMRYPPLSLYCSPLVSLPVRDTNPRRLKRAVCQRLVGGQRDLLDRGA